MEPDGLAGLVGGPLYAEHGAPGDVPPSPSRDRAGVIVPILQTGDGGTQRGRGLAGSLRGGTERCSLDRRL